MFCEQEIIMSYRAAQAFQVQAVWKQQWADTILTLVIQESRCLEQLPTKIKRAHCFSISLFISMLQKKKAIKMCQMMSLSYYFTPNSAPFLPIPSLAKSQSIHFPCYGFGIHHYHLKG